MSLLAVYILSDVNNLGVEHSFNMEFGRDIIVIYGTFSIIYILVTTDVVTVSVCGHSGLWPFRFVAFPVCGHFGLWPFRSVTVPVCGRFCLWPFRSVSVLVCGRFGLWPFRLWPFRFVAGMTCYLMNTVSHTDLSVSRVVQVNISSPDGKYHECLNSVLVVESIPATFPRSTKDVMWFPHLAAMQFSDF